jgi:general secretion pathway protein G
MTESLPLPAASAKRRAAKARLAAKAGYSLIEIMIVLAIIGLIVALVGPRFFAQFDKAKVTTATTQAKSLKEALHTLNLDIGRYPTEQEGLLLLVQGADAAQGWQGPYLSSADLPKDPWKNDYIYIPPVEGQDPRVGSLGADGKEGGSGVNADIVQ